MCVYVCLCVHEKENLGVNCSQSHIILHAAIIQQCDKKYGDGVCLLVLIDTKEQGLAEVILAVFRLVEWDRAIC